MVELLTGHKELEKFFAQQLDKLNVSVRETRAYIQGIFSSYIKNDISMLDESVTLKYIDAKSNHDFEQLQALADWVFFIRATFPEQLRASTEYYDAIAQCSYYRCYLIVHRQWPCFEELADRFPYFVDTIQMASQPESHQDESQQGGLFYTTRRKHPWS